MSDFIYSSTPKPQGELTRHIQSIYHQDPPDVYEYHGQWGSLGVSRNLYNGFQPLETKDHIFVVIGGPVLCFRDNLFLTGNDPVAGTQAIYDRWQSGKIQWDEDLSGPFAILVVDKNSSEIICITDLLMFIPVYQYHQKNTLMLGTHAAFLAEACGQSKDFDLVSQADFILHDIVTYPHTSYKKIQQLHPAALHKYTLIDSIFHANPLQNYWLPEEKYPYSNIDKAATSLREGLKNYVERVTRGMNQVAQFISAGEDSRAIAGLLPSRLKRDSYIFLDSMNREGQIAKRIARAYGTNFYSKFRESTHYLDIMPEASNLIGPDHQYGHAHSLKFHKSCNLNDYTAVFGGYLADSLLKATYARKLRGQNLFPFLPQFYVPGENRTRPLSNECVDKEILKTISQRRQSHIKLVGKFRRDSLHEWFELWPGTMRKTIPYFYSNRRLFRIYEPFMSKEAVKLAASVPTRWKLNRRLFHRMAKPLLKPAKHLPHSQGWRPYYPWHVNMLIHGSIWAWRKLAVKMGFASGNQGPWCDWSEVMKTDAWKNLIKKYSHNEKDAKHIFNKPPSQLFKDNNLTRNQKINLLQVLYLTEQEKTI